jgi:hypothetical protein
MSIIVTGTGSDFSASYGHLALLNAVLLPKITKFSKLKWQSLIAYGWSSAWLPTAWKGLRSSVIINPD